MAINPVLDNTHYKAIIFDFFDVIHADPYHAWLHNHGLKNDGEQAKANNAVDLDQITMQEFETRLGLVTGQTTAEVEAEFAAASIVDYEVVELLAELKRHYPIAVVSNAPSFYLREIIALHKLGHLFDHVIISGEIGYSKPSPEIFQAAMEQLQASPEQTIFIDDNAANVAGAEKLGITGICHTDADSLRQSLIKLGINVEA